MLKYLQPFDIKEMRANYGLSKKDYTVKKG
jgi:hypothetical protein